MSTPKAPANTPTTRSTRVKKPSLKALESLYSSKHKKTGLVDETDEDQDFRMFYSDGEDQEEIERPKLVHEDEHVYGENIFKFQKRIQRDGLAQKVAEACSLETPHSARDTMSKQISILNYASSGSEYEATTSESSDDNSETESEVSNSSDAQESETMPKTKQSIKISTVETNKAARGKRSTINKYTIKTDEYFSSSGKNKTSNNTLDKLETPRMQQSQLLTILENSTPSKYHEKPINSLSELNNSQFKKWLYLLNENFNILVFGLGSKRSILNSFHMEYLKNQPVIVVNGYFPTLSIKNILDAIIVDMLELKNNPSNVFEACDLIEEEMSRIPTTHLYVIINNIEGETIRNGKTQNVLARLGMIRNIHIVASIDHINAPLIWDHSKLSKFNYIWWDITSYMPYLQETSYERSMMVQASGTLALSSLRNVFLSLTTNSKSIYLIIAKHQLHSKNQYYQGFAFKDLYLACREAFIVSSDLALRAQLTEFVDHKMVKLKRSVDGTEYLMIPLASALLQKFLDEQS